jgi:hypothetical protein
MSPFVQERTSFRRIRKAEKIDCASSTRLVDKFLVHLFIKKGVKGFARLRLAGGY